jgi:hypothetical protein
MTQRITPCTVDKEAGYSSLIRLDFSDRTIDEDFLQKTMHEFPEVIPINAIESSYGPLISLGREIDNIDNLYISPNGCITIVEAKLWRNHQAVREVVAQILDYATKLSTWSYEELEKRAMKKGSVSDSLFQHVIALSSDEQQLSESEFIDAVQSCLTNGRFLLLIVGDGIQENIERMLGSLHNHPQKQFTFGLLELQVFIDPQNEGRLLVIPRLLAKTTEVVRGIIRVENTATGQIAVNVEQQAQRNTSSKKGASLSEQEFFDSLPDENISAAFRYIIDVLVNDGAIAGWCTSSVSLKLLDPRGSKQVYNLIVLKNDGTAYPGWLHKQLDKTNRPQAIVDDFITNLCNLFPNVQPSPKWPGSLNPYITSANIVEHTDQFCEILKLLIEDIQAK